MKPEEKARVKIDQWFKDAGWKVINRIEFEANSTAIAVREGKMKHNLEADYLLFINSTAVGVLEAKRVEIDVTSQEVSGQVERYAQNVPEFYPTYQTPLPFLYKSNGKDLYFKDFRNPDSKYERISEIHRPYDLVRKLGIEDVFAGLPTLSDKGLRSCQYKAILGLENSFREGRKRALIVLATGAGKTFLACLAIYRLLSYTPMRRVLFLVDRNNLARQAESAFGQFKLTYNGDPFNTIYLVERLKSNNSLNNSNVVISTIQRLFSFLKGETIRDNDDDDSNDPSENDVVLADNESLPKDYFDLIIVDESHRSIYGKWRKVLDYFSSAHMVGLTATPIPDTMAFFDNNLVINYTLEDSIVDGVNVDSRVYRIKTEVTENGGAIKQGESAERVTVYTGKTETITYTENTNYTIEELNRSIINPSQIKLILQDYKDKVFKEMFPEREENYDYIPKTLIFALNERHANNIVRIAKEVFEEECQRNNNFVQKITYSVNDSDGLIRQFNNDKAFRIAVTCTLVATGTDVPPLEVVMFMRDIQTKTLYTQMKGRGTRTIDDEKLYNVTPNAHSKDYFILIDAVGVTEHEMSMPAGGNEGPTPPMLTLKEILERISHGEILDEYIKRLAGTLARLNKKVKADQKEKFLELSGVDMKELSQRFYNALSNDNLPPFVNINNPNIERKQLVAPLAENAKAREYILELVAGFIEILIPGEDKLIYSGFSVEDATLIKDSFEEYCRENADKIEALRIIYNQTGEAINYAMLKDLEQKLKQENNRFTSNLLWNTYAILNVDKVCKTTGKEVGALTNLIQLVRFAYNQIDFLESAIHNADQYFNLWLGQKHRNLSEEQKEIIKEIFNYVAANGACTVIDIREHNVTQAAQLITAFGGRENANMALDSLYKFVFVRKIA